VGYLIYGTLFQLLSYNQTLKEHCTVVFAKNEWRRHFYFNNRLCCFYRSSCLFFCVNCSFLFHGILFIVYIPIHLPSSGIKTSETCFGDSRPVQSVRSADIAYHPQVPDPYYQSFPKCDQKSHDRVLIWAGLARRLTRRLTCPHRLVYPSRVPKGR